MHLSNLGMLLKKDMELVVRFLQEQLVKDFGYKDDEVIDSLQECLAGKTMVSSHLRGEEMKFCHSKSLLTLTISQKLLGQRCIAMSMVYISREVVINKWYRFRLANHMTDNLSAPPYLALQGKNDKFLCLIQLCSTKILPKHIQIL